MVVAIGLGHYAVGNGKGEGDAIARWMEVTMFGGVGQLMV